MGLYDCKNLGTGYIFGKFPPTLNRTILLRYYREVSLTFQRNGNLP